MSNRAFGRENRRHPEHRTTGHEHLEVIVDDASRYAVVVPVPDETSASPISVIEIAAAEFARLGDAWFASHLLKRGREVVGLGFWRVKRPRTAPTR